MADTPEEFISEMTAITALRGVARLHIMLLNKGVISDVEFETARALTLRDFDSATDHAIPGHPALHKFDARRALIEGAWTPRSATTQEPTRRDAD